MGKNEKSNRQQKQRNNHRREGRRTRGIDEHGGVDDDPLPSHAYDVSEKESVHREEVDDDEEEEEEVAVVVVEHEGQDTTSNTPSSSCLCKFQLYQQSVQSPKGDISYLQKFFLMYVGGRLPLHLQEDFCGTALLSTEWLHSDPRRTATGLDLDLEALTWCLNHNLTSIGSSVDCYSRMNLYHGNVLQPRDAILVVESPFEKQHSKTFELPQLPVSTTNSHSESLNEKKANENYVISPTDIICAFNYSCCCLHTRADLLLYFKHVKHALSVRGGIFVMDLYGGTSSEHKLQLRRRYPNFTYIWEQGEFDILSRKTKISLHFQLGKKQTLRHAFSYDWRLWTLPEIKECLEEVGFQSVHFWMREMPDTREIGNADEFNASSNVKYEESLSFLQKDAWNAYIVGVARRKVTIDEHRNLWKCLEDRYKPPKPKV